MTNPDRTYRFAPADRGSWLLGLTGPQCLLLGGGLASTAIALQAGLPPQIAVLGAIAGVATALAPHEGRPAHEHAATAAAWTASRRRRARHLPDLPAVTVVGKLAPLAPPQVFRELELIAVDRPAWAGSTSTPVGVVVDRTAHTATLAVRVAGGGFSLAGPADQQRALAGWGDLLGGFCTEHNPTSHITVSHWSLPASRATQHATVLTVTARTGKLKTRDRDALGAACAAVLDEARRLTERAATAELSTSTPLSPAQLASVVRRRLDPTARLAPVGDQSVGEWVPMGWHAQWDHVAVDGSVHAAWWVSEWPRLQVPANWLEPLLTTPGTWGLTVHFQPVAPSAARRRIDRDATRLASDATQRAERGFRIGARHHRAEEAVSEREAELVAGYPEIAFCGLITATATNLEELAATASRLQDAAASVGVDLRRLDGRHDLALAAGLPLGRPINPPRLS